MIDSLTAGGAESLVAPFARAWPGELRVCCLKSIGGNPFEAELRVPVTNLRAKNLRDVAAFRRLLRLLREERIDQIHAHLAYASIWGALASRITGIPCVATLHVAPSGAARWSKEGIREALLVRALNRWATRVIAVSASARKAWIERGLRPSKAVVVGNGIELDAFTPGNRGGGGKVVTTVSVLREGKGIEVLLDAVPMVPDARFVIVGDGPLREKLEARAVDRVTWTGFRRDVPELLARSDLFVLPSLGDAYPTVLMEAMAAGLPVVSTRVGGIPEIVDDGRTGPRTYVLDCRASARAYVLHSGAGPRAYILDSRIKPFANQVAGARAAWGRRGSRERHLRSAGFSREAPDSGAGGAGRGGEAVFDAGLGGAAPGDLWPAAGRRRVRRPGRHDPLRLAALPCPRRDRGGRHPCHKPALRAGRPPPSVPIAEGPPSLGPQARRGITSTT